MLPDTTDFKPYMSSRRYNVAYRKMRGLSLVRKLASISDRRWAQQKIVTHMNISSTSAFDYNYYRS